MMIVEFTGVFDISSNVVLKNHCSKTNFETSDRNIVIRIDDIQAYYHRDLQIKMLEELKKRGMVSSLAVIPFNLMEDKKMVRYLTQNKCDFEIGLHGYENTDYEFQNIDYYNANLKLEKGLDILNKIDSEIISFIPPNNEISVEGRQAVFDKGIKVISSGFQNKEFGFSASTFDWERDIFVNHIEVLKDCEKVLDKNETCIIMIHPQDYLTNNKFDSVKYKEYEKLLEGLSGLNATIVTFRDLYYKDNEIIVLN